MKAVEMHGFQLWTILPWDQKMCTPRYQDIKTKDITSLTDDDGTHIRVIAGDYRGYRGPVDGIDTGSVLSRYFNDGKYNQTFFPLIREGRICLYF